MNKILTISIAAYQMEQYIRQTLDSLVDERIIDDIEIFVIDDGGTDRTLEIAREYAARYPASFFPIHKENEGYGSTVNYSIKNATGQYFKCLDGDDWFLKDGLYELVMTLKTTDVDAIITPYYRCVKGEEPKKSFIKCQEDKIGKVISVEDLPENSGSISMWNITYKTEKIRESGLKLPHHMLFTDQYFQVIPFSAVKTVLFLDSYVYCYRLGRVGQSVARESRMRHMEVFLDICKELCMFCEEQRKNNNISYQHILRRMAVSYATALKIILLYPINRNTLNVLKSFETEIKKICFDVDKYTYTVAKGKTAILLQLIRKSNYMVFWMLKFIPGEQAIISRWTRR